MIAVEIDHRPIGAADRVEAGFRASRRQVPRDRAVEPDAGVVPHLPRRLRVAAPDLTAHRIRGLHEIRFAIAVEIDERQPEPATVENPAGSPRDGNPHIVG